MLRFGTKTRLSNCLSLLLLIVLTLPACDSTDEVDLIDGVSLESVSGPYEGAVFTMLSVNDDLFAGGTEGVFYFDNGLGYWQKSLDISSEISALTVSPNGILFAGGTEGLWRSNDQGITWNQILSATNGGFSRIHQIQALANGNVVLATENGGVLRSENGQSNWQSNLTGLDQSSFNAITVDNLDILYTAGGNKVYRSSNGGVTWISVSQNTFSSQVNIKSLITDDLGNLYAGTENRGVYKMMAGGVTWQQIGSISTANQLLKNGGNIYAGGNENFYQLPATGTGWNQIALPNQNEQWQSFAFDPMGNLLAGGNNLGIWKSTTNWKNIGLPVQNIQSILDHETGLYLTTQNAVYLSSDDARSWDKIYVEAINTILPDDDGNWLVAPAGGGLVYSEIGKSQTTVFNEKTIIDLAGHNQNRWAISQGNVYQSSDNGQTWLQTNSPSNQMKSLQGDEAGNLFVIANGGLFYRANSDSVWTNILSESDLSTITIVDENFWLAGGENGFFVTTDGGNSWRQNERNKRVISIVQRQNNAILILLYDDLLNAYKLIQSVDQTATWQEIASDFPANNGLILSAGGKVWQGTTWLGTNQNGLFRIEFE